MTFTDLKRLIANDDCCPDVFCARESEVVSRLKPFCFAALEHERQSVEKSANRTSPIQSVAYVFGLFVWKPPRNVFFGVGAGNDIDRLLLLLQRLDDVLQVAFAIRKKRPDHILARRTDGHAVSRLVIRAE